MLTALVLRHRSALRQRGELCFARRQQAGALVELSLQLCDLLPLGLERALGGRERRGARGELLAGTCRFRERRSELLLLGVELGRACVQLARPGLARGMQLAGQPLSLGQRGLGLFQLELPCERGRLTLGELALTRLRRTRPFLDLRLAAGEQLLGVGAILVDRRLLGPAEAGAARRGLLLLEPAGALLDLELASRHVGGALPESALQLFQL